MNENFNRKEVKNMNSSDTADRIFINAVDEYNLYIDLSRNINEIALPLNNNSTMYMLDNYMLLEIDGYFVAAFDVKQMILVDHMQEPYYIKYTPQIDYLTLYKGLHAFMCLIINCSFTIHKIVKYIK